MKLNRKDFLLSAGSALAVVSGLSRQGWRRRSGDVSSVPGICLREADVIAGEGRCLSLAAVLSRGGQYEFSINDEIIDTGWTTDEGFAPPAKVPSGLPIPLVVDCTQAALHLVPGSNRLVVRRGAEWTMPNAHDGKDGSTLNASIQINGLLVYEETLPGPAWHEDARPLRYRSSAPEGMLLHLVVEYDNGWRRALPLAEATRDDEIHEIAIPAGARVTGLEVVAHGLNHAGPLFFIIATRMGEHRVLRSNRYDLAQRGQSA